MPKLAIVPSNTPNAFTFGRSSNGAVLGVHEGLLRNLNKDEVIAVIAHETRSYKTQRLHCYDYSFSFTSYRLLGSTNYA